MMDQTIYMEGLVGFDKVLWDGEIVKKKMEDVLQLSLSE